MTNYMLWAQLVSSLALSVAASQGADKNALAYLSLLSLGLRAGRLSDAELQALSARVQDDIANNRPVTVDQLDEIEQKIRDASAVIQPA